jgi:hypothetical protein
MPDYTQDALFDAPGSTLTGQPSPRPVEGVGDENAGRLVDSGTAALHELLRARTTTLQSVMDDYDVVRAHRDPFGGGSFLVVAERGTQLADPATTEPSLREIGFASPSPWTSWNREDANLKLRDKLGIKQYLQMKRSDGMVRGSLRIVKTAITAAHWFVKPYSQSARDINAAKFIEDNLLKNLNTYWSCVLEDVLLMLDYGYMVFEKVRAYDPIQGKIVLKKLAPRHPLDIQEWRWDRQGGPNGILMDPNPNDPMFANEPPPYIPIKDLVVFSFEAEAGDLRGISLMRSMYKHWYYKDTLYKIDAIQKERHGIGIPVIKLPPNFNDNDVKTAEALGRNLRVNERAHVVLPPNWELIFAELGGNPVDCLKSVEHHDQMIMASVLAPFITSPGTDPKTMDMFYKSTRYIANIICEIFNKFLVQELIDLNYSRLGGYPRLMARRIGEWEDIRTMSFALRNLVGADVIRSDDPLEMRLREELDLPDADPSTARVPMLVRPAVGNAPVPNSLGAQATAAASQQQVPGAPTPPAPSPAQPPRQTPPSAQPPQRHGGRDVSGG